MTTKVKHTAVADTSFSTTGAAAWNADHTLEGIGTMAEQDANNVAITGGTIAGVAVSGYVPTLRAVNTGTGLTGGGDLSADRTLALANTAVTPGTYGNAARTITEVVDQQGRLTNIFDQPIAIANTQVSGLGSMSTQNANNVAITGGSISGVTVAGVVTAVTGTTPIASTGGATPAISMAKATSLIDGYLSAIDWNTFNNKQPAGSYLTAVTATAPLSGSGTSGSPLVIATANTTTTGALSSTDWNTFNNKQPAGTYVNSVTGTSPVASTGGATPAISLAANYGDTQNPYASKTANFVLAAPNGLAGAPTFRAIVAADIPTLNQNTTGTASNVTGTVAIANGGTGATTAPNALTALGAYPASNPSGYTNNVGTVTSVGGTGTVAGLSLSGTVTSSGNLTLGGTLVVAGGVF